jgi:hypothetical protein
MKTITGSTVNIAHSLAPISAVPKASRANPEQTIKNRPDMAVIWEAMRTHASHFLVQRF